MKKLNTILGLTGITFIIALFTLSMLGGPTELDKKDLQYQAQTIRSIASEGATMTDLLLQNKATPSFVKIQSHDLNIKVGESFNEINGKKILQKDGKTVAEILELNNKLLLQLNALQDTSTDHENLNKVKDTFEKIAQQAQELEESL
jgi:hypothetical protein